MVGILNVTPDSFSDGGKFLKPDRAIAQARQLIADGASIIDIGAESTNPWSSPLSPAEEWLRLMPVVEPLVEQFGNKISIDTYHPETAVRALSSGVSMINDVTMFRDPGMIKMAKEFKDKARYIVSHLSPKSISIAAAHLAPQTTTVEEVKQELLAKRDELIAVGVPPENIILDPGIGFGKTMELNKRLLTFAKEVPGIDVMIGYSRKRFLGDKRMELSPNIEAGKVAIKSGARYLRVHDIAGHRKIID